MPQITTLSINDGTAAVSYVPVTKVGNECAFKDTSASSAAGQGTITASFKPHTGAGKVDTVNINLALPYEETVDGSPHVEHISRAQVKFIIPTAVPSSERTRLQATLANAISNAVLSAMVTGPEGLY